MASTRTLTDTSVFTAALRLLVAAAAVSAIVACQPAFIAPETPVRYSCTFDIKQVIPRTKQEKLTIGGLMTWYASIAKEGTTSRFYKVGTSHARSAVITHDKGLFKRFFMTASTESTVSGDGYLIEYNSRGLFIVSRVPAEHAHHFPRLTDKSQTITRNYCPKE